MYRCYSYIYTVKHQIWYGLGNLRTKSTWITFADLWNRREIRSVVHIKSALQQSDVVTSN